MLFMLQFEICGHPLVAFSLFKEREVVRTVTSSPWAEEVNLQFYFHPA